MENDVHDRIRSSALGHEFLLWPHILQFLILCCPVYLMSPYPSLRSQLLTYDANVIENKTIHEERSTTVPHPSPNLSLI